MGYSEEYSEENTVAMSAEITDNGTSILCPYCVAVCIDTDLKSLQNKDDSNSGI